MCAGLATMRPIVRTERAVSRSGGSVRLQRASFHAVRGQPTMWSARILAATPWLPVWVDGIKGSIGYDSSIDPLSTVSRPSIARKQHGC